MEREDNRMARPKDSTPAGRRALADGHGHKGMRGESQLGRIAKKEIQEINRFGRRVRGEN